MRGIYWVAEDLLACLEGLCSMKLVKINIPSKRCQVSANVSTSTKHPQNCVIVLHEGKRKIVCNFIQGVSKENNSKSLRLKKCFPCKDTASWIWYFTIRRVISVVSKHIYAFIFRVRILLDSLTNADKYSMILRNFRNFLSIEVMSRAIRMISSAPPLW